MAASELFPTAELVTAMAAQWRGEQLGAQRAAELAADLQRIVGHARAAAQGSGFNAEPNGLAPVLESLARGRAQAR
jgi:hypothetical protein